MKTKELILLGSIIIIIIFTLQNLQPRISLVFLGIKSFTFPLSIWIILFAMAGIIVSLIIQLLTKTTSPVNNNFQQKSTSFSSQNPYIPEDKSRKSYPNKSINSEFVNPTYQETYEEFNVSPEKDKYQNVEKNNFAKVKQDDSLIDTMEENEEEKEEEKTFEEINKTRSPLLYSYKPHEKTRIRPTDRNRKLSTSRNKIYDANYRVIESSKNINNQINEDEDFEEWDF